MSSTEKYGIAIDLGTTTIAAALVETGSGRVLATTGGINPQRQYGLDVISRLEYAARSRENLHQLQTLVNDELDRLASGLPATAGVAAAAVGPVAIAGNPAMSQLLLGLPVQTLVRPPYRPTDTGAHRLMTSELGWGLDRPLYVFPSPGGFVGGDTVAFLFGQGVTAGSAAAPCLYLDLGTNGEIVLAAGERLYATSAAAGPAFEGGNLTCGMAALPGAISGVAAENGRIRLQTVGDRPPVGLCGSGVLETIVLLRQEGLLDDTGSLTDPGRADSPLGNMLADSGGERRFVLYRDARTTVALTQSDIRQVQLAKAAVRAGMEVLFHRAGLTAADIGRVVLTGSFGAAISAASLVALGVLTPALAANTGYVREGALAGAARLVAGGNETGVAALADELQVIPLSGTPLFERCFLEQINFPH